MKKLFLLFVFCVFSMSVGLAQCAMCRATLENNVSQGNIGIAAGINFGILYLLVIPYLAVGTLAWFWYRSSRNNGVPQSGQSAA